MRDGSAQATGAHRRLSTAVSADTRQNVLTYLEAFGDGRGVIEADAEGVMVVLASTRDAVLIEAQFPGILEDSPA